MIGWDGAGRSNVTKLLKEKKLPNLSEIVSQGAFVPIKIIGKTFTKSSWAVILTGYKANVTGVIDNWKFKSIPEGYTIFEKLEKFFGKKNIKVFAFVSKLHNMALTPGHPFYLTSKNIKFINGLGKDENIIRFVKIFLNQSKESPFFIFVHFGGIDSAGHLFGENSKDYEKAIINTDQALGQIVKHLKKLGLYEKTIIYVTSDHGFDRKSRFHNNAPFVFLATNDTQFKLRPGSSLDITPTILARYQIDWEKITPRMEGKSLLIPISSARQK